MDLYLTSTVTGLQLHLPLLPDKISVKTGANALSLNLISVGEVKIPRGLTITGYSWNGVLPGQSMAGMAFIRDWMDPRQIISTLNGWMIAGETLNLMLTDSYINDEVFIESFTWDISGVDKISYSINLTQRRKLTVTTMPAPAVTTVGDNGDNASYQQGVVSKSSKVKYRSGPGTKYKVLGKLKKGTKVTIYKTKKGWYLINQDPEWWMKGSYIKVDGEKTRKKGKRKARNSKTDKDPNDTPELDTTNVPGTKLINVRTTMVRTKK